LLEFPSGASFRRFQVLREKKQTQESFLARTEEELKLVVTGSLIADHLLVNLQGFG
jgi:hypothetical protein